MKPLISKGTAKKIIGYTADAHHCFWLEQWIDNLVRGRSLPPKLKSNDFISLLEHYFDSKTASKILQQLREDFIKLYPQDDDFSWLSGLIDSDPKHNVIYDS